MNRYTKKQKNQMRRNERVEFKKLGEERFKINLEGLQDAPESQDAAGLARPLTPGKLVSPPDEIRLDFPKQAATPGNADALDYSSKKLLDPNESADNMD
mmetsp:Transcript_3908/g.4622  ORF Transcript_3908/g.4622 Transcript_3908/m.4622 type:complete len:99 (-) Transcript_3908:230-526(-)